jgi:uncharacterized membrane protein SpoIIM required for sporulation
MAKRVARLLFDGRYIFFCTITWFALACLVGYATATWAVAELRQESPKGSDLPGWGPLFHPDMKFSRAEIKDTRLLRATVAMFVHNTLGLGLVLYLGSILIFVPPIFLFAQGWFLGAILKQGGFQSLMHRTMPHGVIELPVMVACSSVAMLLAIRFYRTLRRGKVKQCFLSTLKEAAFAHIACMPLLFISAVLEGYGTRILWG